MRILVLSPHYDDAPLSLGQSMVDGELARHRVTVGVVCSRSNWTEWFFPTRSRWPLATAIRTFEETVNAVRFRYRMRRGGIEETPLRTGRTTNDDFLIPGYDPTDPANADALAPVEITVRDWSWTADVVISPMALGDHVDHYLTREAARRLLDAGRAVAFYEDRPYACILTDDEIAVKAKELDPRLVRRRVSGPMGPGKHRRMWYPSQFSEEFLSAIASDEAAGRQPAERLVLAWYPRQRLWRVAFYVDGVEQDATLCSSLGSAWRMVRAMRRHHHRHSWWARGSR